MNTPVINEWEGGGKETKTTEKGWFCSLLSKPVTYVIPFAGVKVQMIWQEKWEVRLGAKQRRGGRPYRSLASATSCVAARSCSSLRIRLSACSRTVFSAEPRRCSSSATRLCTAARCAFASLICTGDGSDMSPEQLGGRPPPPPFSLRFGLFSARLQVLLLCPATFQARSPIGACSVPAAERGARSSPSSTKLTG